MSAVVAPVAVVETPWLRFRRQFAESRLALLGLALLAVVVAIALLAPWLAPQNPYDLAKLDLLDARLPPGARAADGMTYWLGTDGQGRDMLSAILYGLRVSLYVGVASGVIALTLGAVVGVLAAYLGGRFEQIVMRVVDIQLGFPAILVALILLAVLGKGVDKIIIALVAVQWPTTRAPPGAPRWSSAARSTSRRRARSACRARASCCATCCPTRRRR